MESFLLVDWRIRTEKNYYIVSNIFPQFTIATANKKALILEFTQPNSRGIYQYHFIRVSSEESPFIKPPNELPDVNVEAIKTNEPEKKWWVFSTPFKRKRKKVKKNPLFQKNCTLYKYRSQSAVAYYGGINPTLRDYIHIKNDGRLIKEHKSRQNGLVVTKRNISREELEKFAEYVVTQEFFQLERLYDCETEQCKKRKKQNPAPVPLRLAVAYKNRRKVVTINIFGKDNRGIQYIDYPPALDKIIAAIQKMALRLEPS